MNAEGEWTIELFEDESGRKPVAEWLNSLSPAARAAAIAAIEHILKPRGPEVCKTEFGKHVGDGIFELRIRHDEITIRRKAGEVAESAKGKHQEVLLRVFCHAYGQRVVLLLNGYDKLADSSKRRQGKEIELARKRLRSFKLEQRRAAKHQQRG